MYGTNAGGTIRENSSHDFPEFQVGYKESNLFERQVPIPHPTQSLDGWLKDQDGKMGVLEIKTTEILKSMQKRSGRTRSPTTYYSQLTFIT